MWGWSTIWDMSLNQTGHHSWIQRDATIFSIWTVNVVILYIQSLVQSFVYFLLANTCLVIMSTGKEWTNSSSFIPVLRIKASPFSYLCVKVFYIGEILYCGLFRWDRRWRLVFKQCQVKNLQPLVIFSFFNISLCLFKATLLCTGTDALP